MPLALTGICNKSMSNGKALQSISRLTKELVFRIRQSYVTLKHEEVEELRKAGGIVSLIGSYLSSVRCGRHFVHRRVRERSRSRRRQHYHRVRMDRFNPFHCIDSFFSH